MPFGGRGSGGDETERSVGGTGAGPGVRDRVGALHVRLYGPDARRGLQGRCTSNLLYGMALLLAYGVGHCLVIVVAGTSTGWVQQYLRWTEQSSGALVVRRICGVLILIGGLYLIYVAP